MAQWTSRGVEVAFPYAAPYDCQKLFVERLIDALQTQQNALLESPTGTGKVMDRIEDSLCSQRTQLACILSLQTLCLLCGSLAWQQAYKAASVYAAGIAEGRIVPDEETQKTIRAAGDMVAREPVQPASSPLTSLLRVGGSTYSYNDGPPRNELGAAITAAATMVDKTSGYLGSGLSYAAPAVPGPFDKDKKPRIIYATRTHSQISQVVRELKRSGYAPQVAILGSRAQVGTRRPTLLIDTYRVFVSLYRLS